MGSCRSILVLAAALVFSTSLFSQPEALVTLDHANVSGGDSVEGKIKLAIPVSCPSTARVFFRRASGGDEIYLDGQTVPNEAEVRIKTMLARDVQGGTYTSYTGVLYPCPGYSRQKNFTVPSLSIIVRELPDKTDYASSATLELSLTQKQFLDTKAAELSDLLSKLDTQAEQHPVDQSTIRPFLLETVDLAEDALTKTEQEYQKEFSKSGDKLPAFFADFHAQYLSLRVHLKRRISNSTIGQSDVAHAKLRFVQLQRRPDPASSYTDARSPEINAVWQTLKDNIAAYLFVKKNSRITFSAKITSYPAGARIRYRRVIDGSYSDFSSPTNVSHAEFELATWEFKFVKDGCWDAVRHIDPYQESEPIEISVEMLHCRVK